ncbi:innate immunity activator protein-like isoform X2 [Brienomyrus brachyistius]|uniref:innate immunity activator protein-like isoform X2 n=1 Tax=Brienomyrus brachyistius TaxID=42636 RepID=UPI0020B29CDE|nr:innate immunity activator protein-like isoform X2 [Brienomyrus brachyistius]
MIAPPTPLSSCMSTTVADLWNNSLIADMGSREEFSDTDSGIILHSIPDSPTPPIKDVTTHTRAVKLKQQSLQDRLELCLLELKKLCIREAELTGELSSDYPLLPGEKPPRIRRRIGAAFKLDEESLRKNGEDSELHALEADLALQTQIYEAARRLSREQHLSRQVRRSRIQHCKLQERKMKELQESLFQLRLKMGRNSPRPRSAPGQKELATISDDSSLSDAGVLDEEEGVTDSSHQTMELHPPSELSRPQPPQTLEGLKPGCHVVPAYERSPIQNSPWKESSLDQPYEKAKRSHWSSSSQSCSAISALSNPVEPRLGEAPLPPQFTPVKNLPVPQIQVTSAPSTPDLHPRRRHSLRAPSAVPPHDLDQDRRRSPLAHRRLTDRGDLARAASEYLALRGTSGGPVYQYNSEDSGSECSASSHTGSPRREAQAETLQPNGHRYAPHTSSPPLGYPRQLAFSGPSLYKTQHPHSTPSFYRGFVEERIGYPAEMDVAYVPHSNGRSRYEFWHEYEDPPQQWVLHSRPANARLARTPSLRDYSSYHYHMSHPQEAVSDELRFWHQRNQMLVPRPHSLDRQGAVRIRTYQGRESPLTPMTHQLPEQVPQARIIHRPSDGRPIQWYIEEDSEIISQM